MFRPTNDFAFKLLFAENKNKDLLLDFKQQLTNLSILNPNINKKSINDKFSVVDIIGENEN